MSLADPGLALILHTARLSEVVGREVTATHLRPKPGVSTVAALVDPDGTPWGWVRTLTGASAAKADKARLRAAELGLAEELGEARLGGRDTLVQWGPLATDPRLATTLSGLELSGVEVLRHNPLRRLVGRLEPAGLVVRVTAQAHRDRLTSVVNRLARRNVPVLTPAVEVPDDLPRGRGVTWWPWVEGTDASSLDRSVPGAEDLLKEVGAAVGRLHSVDPSRVRQLRTRGWADVRAAAVSSVELLEAVSPGNATGARRVLDQLPARAPGGEARLVVCHGDLSLDQVLLHADGGPVLIDLDRAASAPAVLDHAAFAAVDLVGGHDRLGPVGEGYADATGSHPDAPGPWVAAVLLSRIAEPWRHQVPGWSAETVRLALLAGRALETDDVWARSAPELADVP